MHILEQKMLLEEGLRFGKSKTFFEDPVLLCLQAVFTYDHWGVYLSHNQRTVNTYTTHVELTQAVAKKICQTI